MSTALQAQKLTAVAEMAGLPVPEIVGVVEANRRARVACDVAGLASGALTQEQFDALHPDTDLPQLLADQEFAREAERAGASSALQEAAFNAKSMRALSVCLDNLATKTESPDCKVSEVRETAELISKMMNSFQARGESAERREWRGGERVLTVCSEITVRTAAGEQIIQIAGRAEPDIRRDMLRAMQCVTEDEVAAVVGVPLRYAARLRLGNN